VFCYNGGEAPAGVPSLVWLAAGLPSILFGQIMMRPTHIAIALALCATAAAVSAQPAQQASSVPPADGSAIPADVPETEEAQEAPRTVVTETRKRGQVTGATVTRGNNTYYLKPNAQAGSAQVGDAQSSGNRAAQWQVFQFDWQREHEPARNSAPPPDAIRN
jgi:hypothetical protein